MQEQVHDPHCQRVVRPNYREINIFFPGQRHQTPQILGGNRHALDQTASPLDSFLPDPGIARRAPKPGHVRRLGQFPHQRMFPTARPDD
jgi:hypothetical protein